jgi:hypothetical protein
MACSSSAPERTYWLDDLHLDKAIGLPVTGDGKLVVSRSLIDPSDWSNVTGHATFLCEDCAIGDDRATLHLDDWYWSMPGGADLYVGRLAFPAIEARADVTAGRVHATATTTSPDVEIAIRIDGTLAKTIADSDLNGCIRFRPTAALQARDPKLYSLLNMTGASQDAQGWFHIALEGRAGSLKRLAKPCAI